ncbi:hypothetical protein B0H13DRAFT_2684842 [Mycena leptocephala]|nr:hypothetical protein B0H13DRAFT_2684842 [Mycena leptocephala]
MPFSELPVTHAACDAAVTGVTLVIAVSHSVGALLFPSFPLSLSSASTAPSTLRLLKHYAVLGTAVPRPRPSICRHRIPDMPTRSPAPLLCARLRHYIPYLPCLPCRSNKIIHRLLSLPPSPPLQDAAT